MNRQFLQMFLDGGYVPRTYFLAPDGTPFQRAVWLAVMTARAADLAFEHLVEVREQLRREVESGGGSGDGNLPVAVGIDGLVAFEVLGPVRVVGALDVRFDVL